MFQVEERNKYERQHVTNHIWDLLQMLESASSGRNALMKLEWFYAEE